MTPEQEQKFNQITDRLNKINFGKPFDNEDRRCSAKLLFREHVRRIQAFTEGESSLLIPISDKRLTPEINNAINDYVRQLATKERYIMSFMKGLLTYMLQWHLTNTNEALEPYEPLIRLFERGVYVTRTKSGLIEMWYADYREDFFLSDLSTIELPTLNNLSDEILNKFD